MRKLSNHATALKLVEEAREDTFTRSPQRLALDNYYKQVEAIKLKRLDFWLNCCLAAAIIVGVFVILLLLP